MMKKLQGILAGLAALFAALFFIERFRRKSAEGLLENVETKEKIVGIDKEINKNEAEIKTEETKREEIKKELNNELNKSSNEKDLEDFLNGKK